MSATTVGQQLKRWGVAVRPFAYPASIVPVVLGSVYALYGSRHWHDAAYFHWPHFLLALVAGMLYHTGCNLINDYCDYQSGVDREGTLGGSGMLVSGTMLPRQILTGSIVSLGLGTLIGLYFIWYFSMSNATSPHSYPLGWPLLAIGGAGLLGTILYTATPWNAKYHALGEPLVFSMMGIGMVLGGYFVQRGTLDWNALWVSLPVSFTVAAILQANDTRDIVDDRAAGITTISTAVGPGGARWFYTALLTAPYFTILILVITCAVPWTALLAIVTLPLAVRLLRMFWSIRDERPVALRRADEFTAQLHLALGLMLSLGILIGHWLKA